MRVLLISGSFPPMICGVGDYAGRLAEELSYLSDLEVAVITSAHAATPDASAEKIGKATIHRIMKNWNFFELGKILSLIKRLRPQLVHIQYPTLGYGQTWLPNLLPFILGALRMRVVQTWHEPPTRLRYLPNAIAGDSLIFVEPGLRDVMRRPYPFLIRHHRIGEIPLASSIPRVSLTDAERRSVKAEVVGDRLKMVVFFGFLHSVKAVELLFQIADPETDKLVLITSLDPSDPYHQNIASLMQDPRWQGRVVITGNLPAQDVARLLSAADAAVFPFEKGLKRRNTSFLAAAIQGTFVITTSLEKTGYDEENNVYYARPGDVNSMRAALANGFCSRRVGGQDVAAEWATIAEDHRVFYQNTLSGCL